MRRAASRLPSAGMIRFRFNGSASSHLSPIPKDRTPRGWGQPRRQRGLRKGNRRLRIPVGSPGMEMGGQTEAYDVVLVTSPARRCCSNATTEPGTAAASSRRRFPPPGGCARTVGKERRCPMSFNSFGHLFRVTTWGESHGPALGATVDGCPPGIALTEAHDPALDGRAQARPEQIHHPAARAGRGRDPLGGLRRRDHRHADPADDPQCRPALEGLRRDRRELPARPCRHHLLAEIRRARLSRRRPLLGARNRRPGRRRRRGAAGARRARAGCRAARATWSRWAPMPSIRASFDWTTVGRQPVLVPRPGGRRSLGRQPRRAAQIRQFGRRGDRGARLAACRPASARRSMPSSTPRSRRP